MHVQKWSRAVLILTKNLSESSFASVISSPILCKHGPTLLECKVDLLLRPRSNCKAVLVQHIVNFSFVKQEQRGRRRNNSVAPRCCTNNAVQFDPSLRVRNALIQQQVKKIGGTTLYMIESITYIQGKLSN